MRVLLFHKIEVYLSMTIRLIYSLFMISIMIGSELDDGIIAYEKRADGAIGAKALSPNIDMAITVFEKAVSDPHLEEISSLYLLKSYYYKGTFVLTDENERKIEYTKGKVLGEEMVAKYPDSANLRYWYLTCLGKWAEVYGIFNAAKEGVADLMKEHSEAIIELDPELENGGGYFMLGAVHFKSPYIPFILSWPDNDDAILWLQKAVNMGEATPVQNNYLARALYKNGQKKKAIRLVREVISTPPDPENLVEERFEIDEAKRLLTEFK
ncbi:MAG: tetratricopeptide repeat protein [Fidelibacterota bacterium]